MSQFQQSAGDIPYLCTVVSLVIAGEYRGWEGMQPILTIAKSVVLFTFPISCLPEHVYMVADNSPFIFILFGPFALLYMLLLQTVISIITEN